MTAEKEKGPTRAQLLAKVSRLERQIERLRRPDAMRRAGEHWYELVDLFDPTKFETFPLDGIGPSYVLGTLQGMIILEVPVGTPHEAIRALLRKLREQGAPPVFAVTQGVRFVRLRALDADEERKIDEVVRGEGTSGAGPELHGDRLGGDPGGRHGARDGSDRDGEGEGEGTPDDCGG